MFPFLARTVLLESIYRDLGLNRAEGSVCSKVPTSQAGSCGAGLTWTFGVTRNAPPGNGAISLFTFITWALLWAFGNTVVAHWLCDLGKLLHLSSPTFLS